MKRGGIRDCSMPFDWLWAFPSDVKDSLDRDFSDWLDPQYLTVYKNDLGHFSTKHANYDTHTEALNKSFNYTKKHAFFNHHDLLSDKGKEAFEKRIKRYKEALQSDEVIVLITNSSVESIKEAGLDVYYKDRPAKTVVVHLSKQGDGEDSAKLVEIDGSYVMTYICDTDYNNNVSNLICKELKRHFEPQTEGQNNE